MSWRHILGHEAQTDAFSRAVGRGRLAHAYLFVGLPGIGKRWFAQELAKALLCERGTGRDGSGLAACDQCPDCKQVAAGSHPDLFMTGRPEDKLELPIEVMRELCDNFYLKSARGRGRIAILDDADDLNEEGANCFLKTLEEPPPRSVLILIGSTVDRQLPTVVSRCQVVRFAPLREEQVVDILKQHNLENAAEATRLARLSGGSPGLALELADPALWEFRPVFMAGLTGSRVDSVALANQWQEFVEKAGKEAGVRRRRASQVVRLIVQMVRDAVALASAVPPTEIEPEYLKALQQLVQRVPVDELLDLQDRCLEADTQIDRRVQLDLVLQALTDAWGKRVMQLAT
jgi:DNA polymerase III subunit delta'